MQDIHSSGFISFYSWSFEKKNITAYVKSVFIAFFIYNFIVYELLSL